MPKPPVISSKTLVAAILASAFLFSGCGIKGSLDTPPPLWGDEKPAQPEPEPETDPDDFSG